MGTEYAPQAIEDLFAQIDRGFGGRALLAGVIGDAAHVYGYHRASAVLPTSDYSKQYGKDQVSGDLAWAASGLDISWERAEDHYTASSRLLSASKAGDSRLGWLRSWFGSDDGREVIGWDLAAGAPATSDDTHLWHIHLSIHRQAANTYSKLSPIGDVMTGGAAAGGIEDDMPERLQVKRIEPLRVNRPEPWDLKFDQEDWDTGAIFYGKNKPEGEQKGGWINTGGNAGASYVSTATFAVRGLAEGQEILTALAYYDASTGAPINQSGWQEHRAGSGGNLEVVDTRTGYSNPGRGLGVRVKCSVPVDILSPVWAVIHWPQ